MRIQPSHVSFADPAAIPDIYGQKTKFEKDIFYSTLSTDEHDSIVSTRNRDEHSRKRRYISNVFSQRNVVSMEPLVADKVRKLVTRLDEACKSGEVIDIRQWLNFFTFDVISEMTFGSSSDFLVTGREEIMAESLDGKLYEVKPIQAFQDNTVHVASLGHFVALLPLTRFLTRWCQGSAKGQHFTDMCIRKIRQRLKLPNVVSRPGLPFGDFFQHLLANSKGEPRKLPFPELVHEAGVFLSAGSDTTASSMTNALYLLMKNPRVIKKLRNEINEALGGIDNAYADDISIFTSEKMSQVRYLRACLDEALRDLPPTSIGLLRMTPPEGATVAGHYLKGGITASVPTYTIHHDANLFPDPFAYKPERWLESSEEERRNLKTCVIPFTLGRHACIGRNIAFLEQYLVIATLVHRYEFEFAEEGFELAVLERINANPGPLPVKLRRRTAEL